MERAGPSAPQVRLRRRPGFRHGQEVGRVSHFAPGRLDRPTAWRNEAAGRFRPALTAAPSGRRAMDSTSGRRRNHPFMP